MMHGPVYCEWPVAMLVARITFGNLHSNLYANLITTPYRTTLHRTTLHRTAHQRTAQHRTALHHTI
jgi:hypothetical protein